MSPKVSQEYKEKRRNEIIVAAKTVFIKKGFELTTMHDVVEESGMSRGGVYQYFSNTEEMMRAILDKEEGEFTGQSERLHEKYKKCWGILESVVNSYNQVIDPFGLITYEYFVAGIRGQYSDRIEYMEKRLTNIKGFYIEIINEGIETGEFHASQSPEVIASYMIVMTDGISLHGSLKGTDETSLKGMIEGLKIYLRQVLGIK